jgi:NodT family efflux transporter outer membrane factor (OMF) lipoprotein
VALAAINEGALRGQIAATEQIIAAEENSLATMEREVTLGQIAESDAIAEHAALAQTRATLPPLKQKLAQQRSALAVLLGRHPSDDTASQFTLDNFTVPKSLPLSLPSAVIDRRPDVRAAEATYHAALAEVGVATANMLPNITITGDTGSSAASFGTLFTPGTGFWHLAAGLTQPLFQAGALVHKRRAAVAAATEAEELYESAVLTALQSVSDVLHALTNDAALVDQAQVAADAAGQSLTIVQKQIEFGQVSGLALLDAQRVYQQAVVVLTQAKAARLSDVVALFQALGGGRDATVSSSAAGAH